MNHWALLFLIFLAVPVFTQTASSQTLRPLPYQNVPITPNISMHSLNSAYTELPIQMDESGLYFVYVGWKNASKPFRSNSNDSTNEQSIEKNRANSTGKMLLNLYSNISFVTDCTGFLPYDCNVFECVSTDLEQAWERYLYHDQDVYGYKVSIGMESQAFSLCGYSVIFAMSCSPGFPTGFSGFLGFGHALNALFEVNKNFSVFLSDGKDGFKSALYAGKVDNGQRIDSSKNYALEVNTDSNWRMTISQIKAQAQKGSRVTIVDLERPHQTVFDINTEVIGLPIELYHNITSILDDYGVVCIGHRYKPICSLSRSWSSLPTFYFTISSDKNKMVEIKPEMYLMPNETNPFYTLMFGALTLDNVSPLAVNSKFGDTIILGRPFLTYYYVHFAVAEDYGNPYITMYVANHNENKPDSIWLSILIIGGCILFSLITIGGCLWICMRFKKNKKGEKPWDMEQDDSKHEENHDTKEFIEKKLLKPLIRYSIGQRTNSVTSSRDKKVERAERVWSNENIRQSKASDIQAHTYGKQKLGVLYGSYDVEDE